MRRHLDQPHVRRSVQVGPDEVPPYHLQCLRIRLLQALQLQAVIECSLLQRNALAHLEVGREEPPRLLVNHWRWRLLGHLRLLDVHFLQVSETNRECQGRLHSDAKRNKWPARTRTHPTQRASVHSEFTS